MVTGKRAKQLEDRKWQTPGAEGIREEAGTQLDRIYIEQQQATVAQWVALHPLFEVCARETWYEGGGLSRKVCWCQEARRKQLCATLEELREDKRRRSRGGEIGI